MQLHLKLINALPPSERPACWLGHVNWLPVSKYKKLNSASFAGDFISYSSWSLTQFPLPACLCGVTYTNCRSRLQKSRCLVLFSLEGFCLTNCKNQIHLKKRLPAKWDLQQLFAKGIKWRAVKVLQEIYRHFPCYISNWIDKLREKFSKWISGIIRPEAAPWLHGNTPPPKLCHVCPHFGGQRTPNRIGGFKKIGLLTAQRQPIQLIQKHSSLRLSNRTLKREAIMRKIEDSLLIIS